MTNAERKWDQEELDLFSAGRAESPAAGSADGVLAALGLDGPFGGPGGAESAPQSGRAPVSHVPPPAASGIFARPSTWVGAGLVLALVPAALIWGGGSEAEVVKAPEAVVAPVAPVNQVSVPVEQAPSTEQVIVPADEAAQEAAAIPTPRKVSATAPVKRVDAESDAPGRRPSLAEELAIIKQARAQLNSGNLSGAEAALARHAKDFNPPRLASEARVIRVEILVKRGQKAQARALAAPLMKENSPYRARMETLLSSP